MFAVKWDVYCPKVIEPLRPLTHTDIDDMMMILNDEDNGDDIDGDEGDDENNDGADDKNNADHGDIINVLEKEMVMCYGVRAVLSIPGIMLGSGRPALGKSELGVVEEI